jgi:hypothetical protein
MKNLIRETNLQSNCFSQSRKVFHKTANRNLFPENLEYRQLETPTICWLAFLFKTLDNLHFLH